MTRDEILAMPAGREMDALVAEKVMGWHVSEGPLGSLCWDDADGNFKGLLSGRGEDNAWRPSYDIAAAMDVLAPMRFYRMSRTGDDYTEIEIEDRFGDILVHTDKTECLAICRAALLTVYEEAK